MLINTAFKSTLYITLQTSFAGLIVPNLLQNKQTNKKTTNKQNFWPYLLNKLFD